MALAVRGAPVRLPWPCRAGMLRRSLATAVDGASPDAAAAKERVVIIGAGWAGFSLARSLDKHRYDVSVVSPRNHFLFTPLLPSTAVGTLEFRAIQEPVRTIRGLGHYFQAKARALDTGAKTLTCETVYDKSRFNIPYDKLVLACGTLTNTFGVEGVVHGENNLFFLKQLDHARSIRNHICECFEKAAYPTTSEEERRRLLHFVIVGGGPISVEFAGELNDFVTRDLSSWYPDLKELVTVTLVEASDHILGTFDKRLVAYVERLMAQRKFDVRKNMSVKKVEKDAVVLADDTRVPCGMVVWSTGVAPTRFTGILLKEAKLASTRNRLHMDARMRLLDSEGNVVEGVYGLGDVAVNPEKPLPTLGAVARMQANYLAGQLNAKPGSSGTDFEYTSILQMSAFGQDSALVDPTVSPLGKRAPILAGLIGKLVWATAYWGTQVSITNKMLIPMYWFKSWMFGRDISKF